MIDVTRQLLGPGPLPSVEHPRNFVIADFNHDGRQDLFVAAHGYDAPPFSGEANVLLISNPDGTYTDRSSTIPQAPDYSHSACVGDINGDDHLDIYVGNVDIVVGPYFLLGNGDGTFRKAQSGLPAQILSAKESFLSCAIVDIDGDGLQDLVLGTWSHDGYFDSIILFGDGAGDFTRRARSVLPAGPLGNQTWLVDIVPVDVDRDGRPDLILLSGTSSGFLGLQVLINKGSGSFADETPARIGPSAVRMNGVGCIFLRLVDLDGDGWDDFYCDMPSWDAGAPRYWMNNGDGTWSPASTDQLPGGSSFGYMSPLDFDRDGRPDIVQFNPTPEGDVGYQSFQNRTPRTGPVLSVVAAGPGAATSDPPGITCGSDCSENYAVGTSVRMTATPSAGSIFNGWGGACTGTGSCTLSMLAATNVTAAFNFVGAGSANANQWVQKAYVAYYGRPADPGGLMYWANRMDQEGGSLSSIIGAFGYSDEFNRRYGGLSYTTLVTKIYQQILGRDPEQGGLVYYVGELQAGRRTLQAITLDVLNGATGSDALTVANRLDVADHYTGKVAVGCSYGSEQTGVSTLATVTPEAVTVSAAKADIEARCRP